MLTVELDYPLPPEAVAQTPVEPRHTARLFDTRTLTHRTFLELADLLEQGDLLVVNRTRVRAARLLGRKVGTGGRVEALLARRLSPERWEALVRPARRLRTGTLLEFGPLRAELVSGPHEGVAELVLYGCGDVEELVEEAGEVPLPPYINRPLSDPDRYQTVFASQLGSSAAPTAGLHFTSRLLEALAKGGWNGPRSTWRWAGPPFARSVSNTSRIIPWESSDSGCPPRRRRRWNAAGSGEGGW